ncbi:hypothetical protein C1645_824045 [Glomus cerebriforme]|uniref:Uncharacterized protein n=1 Tax=Glomus cerebriforme TaxID=658196 RepID=A0A397SZA0_9GLOM|nr:hypothetical protein C1645_824045 [Glomus cerebriforme]
MEITIPKGKDRSEELKNFKEEMVKAIKEVEIVLGVREENKKKSENDSELGQARMVAFQEIEKSMNERDLKAKDLGQYSNYQEKINSLGEESKTRDNFRPMNNPYPPRGQLEYWNNNNPNFLSYNPRPRENPNYYPSRSNFNPEFSVRPDFLRTEPGRVPDRRNEP